MTVPKSLPDQDLRIKIACRMDKPLNMKHGGFLFCIGKSGWKKWKRRFFVLVQVSQYTFAMCSYKEVKSEPSEMMQLDGYTVDYIEQASGKCHSFILHKVLLSIIDQCKCIFQNKRRHIGAGYYILFWNSIFFLRETIFLSFYIISDKALFFKLFKNVKRKEI